VKHAAIDDLDVASSEVNSSRSSGLGGEVGTAGPAQPTIKNVKVG
jgi:hypothetical protein